MDKKKSIPLQLKKTKKALLPKSKVHDGMKEFTVLIEMFYAYMEEKWTKK